MDADELSLDMHADTDVEARGAPRDDTSPEKSSVASRRSHSPSSLHKVNVGGFFLLPNSFQ
jgi:hypothetical protein